MTPELIVSLLEQSPELALALLADAPLLVVVWWLWGRPSVRRWTRALEHMSSRLDRIERTLSLPPLPPPPPDDRDDLTPRFGVRREGA